MFSYSELGCCVVSKVCNVDGGAAFLEESYFFASCFLRFSDPDLDEKLLYRRPKNPKVFKNLTLSYDNSIIFVI